MLVCIISFVKFGPNEAITQNNAFLCLIICSILGYFQMKYKPFITKELNDLNKKSSLIIILSIYLALFMSFCQDLNLEIALLVLLLAGNSLFNLITMMNYLKLKIVLSKKSKFFSFLKNFVKKIFLKKN